MTTYYKYPVAEEQEFLFHGLILIYSAKLFERYCNYSILCATANYLFADS